MYLSTGRTLRLLRRGQAQGDEFPGPAVPEWTSLQPTLHFHHLRLPRLAEAVRRRLAARLVHSQAPLAGVVAGVPLDLPGPDSA